jgi:multimeric flavodoxin WrbA
MDFPQAAPADFRPLAEQMFATDAFILVTPEYNGSYSPALKNLLDHFPKQHHKTFGIVTASPGPWVVCVQHSSCYLLVPALFGIASPYMLVVPGVEKSFLNQANCLMKNLSIRFTIL